MIYPFLLQNWRRLKTIKIISVLINVLWNEHVQTLYQCLVSVWQYELRAFKKIITFSSIILLRKFIRDTDKDAYSKMFTTALFIVRRNYKSSQSPAIGGRRNQFWCIQMIREYAAIKNHIFEETWVAWSILLICLEGYTPNRMNYCKGKSQWRDWRRILFSLWDLCLMFLQFACLTLQ